MTLPFSSDSINVQIGAQVTPLVEAFGQAGQSVQIFVDKLQVGMRQAANTVEQESEKMAVSAEGLSRRFEHVGVAMAFAASSLANDSERGVTRAAHALALFGFAFGPIAGAASTAGAIILENFVSSLSKTEEQAKKTKEKVEEMYRAIGEGGNLQQAAKRQQQLYSGDKFVSDQDPFAEQIRGGGIQALQNRANALQVQIDAISAKIQKGLKDGFDSPEAYEALQANAAKLHAQLDPINEQLTVMKASYQEIKDLVDELTAKAVDKGEFEGREKQSRDFERLRIGAEKEFYRNQLENRRTFARLGDDLRKQDEEKLKASKEKEKQTEDQFYRQLEIDERDYTHQRREFQQGLEEQERRNDQARREREAEWSKFFNATFASAVSQWVQTGENLREFWRSLWADIVQTTISALTEMLVAHEAHELAVRHITLQSAAETIAIKTWEAIKWIGIEAAKAAASAWAALAGIPIVGPALGVVAAAATLAGVLALAHNLSGGGGSPGGGGGTTAPSAATATSTASRSTGQGNVYVIQALDAQSFKAFAARNPDGFAHGVAAAVKNGSLTPKKLGLSS